MVLVLVLAVVLVVRRRSILGGFGNVSSSLLSSSCHGSKTVGDWVVVDGLSFESSSSSSSSSSSNSPDVQGERSVPYRRINRCSNASILFILLFSLLFLLLFSLLLLVGRFHMRSRLMWGDGSAVLVLVVELERRRSLNGSGGGGGERYCGGIGVVVVVVVAMEEDTGGVERLLLLLLLF